MNQRIQTSCVRKCDCVLQRPGWCRLIFYYRMRTIAFIFLMQCVSIQVQTRPPAETSSIRRDVDAAVGQVGGDGDKLIDKTRPAHQSEGVDQLVVISNHTENVACRHHTDRDNAHILTTHTHTHALIPTITVQYILVSLDMKILFVLQHSF